MSVNFSKVDVSLLNFSRYNLSEKQLNSLQYNINNLGIKNFSYADTIKELKNKLEYSYIVKSSKLLEYFVKNNLKSKNIKTKKIKDYSLVNGMFKYANDFYYDVKSNDINEVELKFKEYKKGDFLSNKDKLYSYKKIAKVMYLDYVNKQKEKVFITFTLPNGQFHKYNKNGFETNTFNSNDIFEENVKKGLKLLNEIHRYFYHTLKYKIRRYCKSNNITNKEVINIDFIKILEPHKSLDGHLHSLFYIDKSFLNIVEEVYSMTIDNFKLKETTFEILKNAKASTYLNKYLLKTTKSENLFYNQYKRYFSKTRFFTSSNFRHTNQEKIEIVYKFLNQYKPKIIRYLKRGNIPIYYQLEQIILKDYIRFQEEKIKRISINFQAIKEEFGKLKNKKDIDTFKRNILKNIDNYIKEYNSKTIQKIYFKKWLIYNKKHNEQIPIYNYEFEKLKINPFIDDTMEMSNFSKTSFF